MSDWIEVKGRIDRGYGVASGQAQNPRFPHGTIEMQKPFFQAKGLDLTEYFSGTINVSILPCKYTIKRSRYTFQNIKWSPTDPAEDFSFFDCKILLSTGNFSNGLIYYPHPETKPEHFQSPDIIELMAPFIDGLNYGDELIVAVNSQQLSIDCESRSSTGIK